MEEIKTIKELKKQIDSLFVERNLLRRQNETLLEEVNKYEAHHSNALKARAVLQMVAKNVQEHLQEHFSKLVSMALESVFENPYKFTVEFEEKRGKTECKLLFERDGYKIDPLTSSGGGPIDIACFALRVAFLIMSSNRRVIVLDEPFKNLRSTLHEAAGNMVKHLSEKLGIQFIIVTHLDDMIGTGDKVIEIEKIKKISKIKEKEAIDD
jgi:DNA repair exonuclease SbcCD ATPase subunit